MDISIETLIEQSGAPVSLPEVFIQINKLTQNQNSTVADIARIAETDIGLSSRLLRIVNSPYYGFPSNINSIPRAIAIIGTQDLRDLALATTTIDLFANMHNKQNHIKQLWRQCLYCAVISKMLAEALGEQHTEQFFVSGLLHDIGRLILYQAAPEAGHQLLRQNLAVDDDILTAEESLFGFSHTEVGSCLVRKWNLPDNIIEVTACHHTPEEAHQFPMETAIIYIANLIVGAIEREETLESILPSISTTLMETSKLTNGIINDVMLAAPGQFMEIHELLFPKNMAA